MAATKTSSNAQVLNVTYQTKLIIEDQIHSLSNQIDLEICVMCSQPNLCNVAFTEELSQLILHNSQSQFKLKRRVQSRRLPVAQGRKWRHVCRAIHNQQWHTSRRHSAYNLFNRSREWAPMLWAKTPVKPGDPGEGTVGRKADISSGLSIDYASHLERLDRSHQANKLYS